MQKINTFSNGVRSLYMRSANPKFFGLAKYTKTYQFLVRFSVKMCFSVILMYALYICTYLLTYSYVELLF